MWDRAGSALDGRPGSFEASRWFGNARYRHGDQIVVAVQLDWEFEVSGGPYPGIGAAEDWLVQADDGSCWPVDAKTFARYYSSFDAPQQLVLELAVA